jgi:hypothetical protein
MLGGYCQGQPRGSPKKPGGVLLKTCKKAQNTNTPRTYAKHTRTAQPTPRWPSRPTRAAQQSAPSSEVRLARGLTLPRAGSASKRVHAILERAPPRSRVPASLERAPPPSRLPHKRACSRTRVQAFNALTQQSRAITRLGITSQRCSANSLGGAHPRHYGGLCDEAGVSSVTLCCPL